MWKHFYVRFLQTCFTNWYLEHFLWNWFQVSATEPRWWWDYIDSGNSFGNTSLSGRKLIQTLSTYGVTTPRWVDIANRQWNVFLYIMYKIQVSKVVAKFLEQSCENFCFYMIRLRILFQSSSLLIDIRRLHHVDENRMYKYIFFKAYLYFH